MTKLTHRRIAINLGYIGIVILHELDLLPFNYYCCIPIMLLVCQWWAKFPDFDHLWKNIAERDALKFVINKFIRATGGKHRSKHTHSADIYAIFCLGLLYGEYKLFGIGHKDHGIIMMYIFGVIFGWGSHLFADMLTSDGIYLTVFSKKKVALVPKEFKALPVVILSIMALLFGAYSITMNTKHLGLGIILIASSVALIVISIKYRGLRFNTGNEWEGFVQRVFSVLNVVTAIFCVSIPILRAVEHGNIESFKQILFYIIA